jgi:hypothetical protein
MGNDSLFYPPPQPQQRIPYAPIPTPPQVDNPPRRNLALAMAVVVASWPTGLEYAPQQPRPSAATIPAAAPPAADQPTQSSQGEIIFFEPERYVQRPVQIAPLISAPAAPQVPFVRQPQHIVDSWQPPDPWRQLRSQIVPLTLVYGDQPPKLLRQPLWMAEDVPWRQSAPQIAPLIPAVVAAERVPFVRQPQLIVDSWTAPEPWRQPRVQIVPLTLVYGDQPPKYSHVVQDVIRDSWNPPFHYDWRRGLFIFGVQVDQPPPSSRANLNSILAINWAPAPPQPQVKPPVAPLTLVYGDQPPRLKRQQIPFPELEFYQQPRPTLPTQPVVVTFVPGVRFQSQIVAAWDVAAQPVQRRVTAPLPSVDNPPRMIRQRFYEPVEPPLPTLLGKVAALIPPPRVDQPPRQRQQRIDWPEPPFFQPQLPGVVTVLTPPVLGPPGFIFYVAAQPLQIVGDAGESTWQYQFQPPRLVGWGQG